MPPVLLLREPDMPFEADRLATLLAERLDGVEVAVLRPHRYAPLTWNLLRRRPHRTFHAFGRRALALACLAADASVLFTATRFPTSADVAWLRAAIRYREVKIVCGSDAERRAWLRGGVPADRCRWVRPGVVLTRPAPDERRRFGLSEADRVVFTPLPAVGNGRAVALWAGCLLNVLDPTVKTIAWSDGGVDGRTRLAASRLRLIDPVACVIDPGPDPAGGFAACDAVLLPPDAFVPPTLIAMAMASGKPIVAHANPHVRDVLENDVTALLTDGHSPNAMADRATDVWADPAVARRVADRARAEAYERFGVSRLMADYRTLYAGRTDAAAFTTEAAAASV